MTDSKPQYPQTKVRELTETEKAQLRARIESGDADIYKLAGELQCSPSQVAGVEAALRR